MERNLDCVALTETWLLGDENDNVALSALTPPGYNIRHVPRTSGRGGGVAFIYRDHLTIRQDINQPSSSSYESMTVTVNISSLSFCFIILYRVPPSCSNKIRKCAFMSEFADLLECVATQPGKLVILGDFNVHWDVRSNPESLKLSSLLDSFGMKQHVITSTHIAGHTLDLVMSRESDDIVDDCSASDFISDHNAVLLTLKCGRPHACRQNIVYRKMKSIDASAFASDVHSSFMGSDENESIDTAVAQYNNILTNALNKHAPERTKSVVVRAAVPWMTSEILDAKRKRRHLEKLWRKSLLTVHRLEYKRQCDVVSLLVKRSKSSYFLDKINNCAGDQKKLFKVVDNLLGRTKATSLPTASSSLLLAEEFNQYFALKISKIRDDLDILKESTTDVSFDLSSSMVPSSEQLCLFSPASEKEVENIVKNSSKASCASDPVSSSLVINILPAILVFITNIINLSLSTGVFPSDLKSAIVCPLLKKPSLDSEVMKNYRPVSNLSFLSKLIEKVIASRLVKHLQNNGLSDKFQSAYRKFHSTETALLRVQNDILCSIDKGKHVFLILLDLSAAFDTVDHSILLAFLHDFIGLSGTALNILRSYLLNRTQKVSIHNIFSNVSELLYGVPQGSVLGPLIFCIYTLPLCAILRHHNIDYHIYADDTQLYCCFDNDNSSEVLAKMMSCISDIRSWMIRNKLKINDEKTEFLMLSSPRSTVKLDSSLQIGGVTIEASSFCRNLGVYFDDHLSMDKHIANVCKCMMYHIRSIAAIRPLLTESATSQLVHSLITSRLDYCNSLMYGLSDSLIYKLQRIQNIAARIVTRSDRHCHIQPVLFKLHWLPVKFRILFKILLLTFRSFHGSAPKYLTDLITPYIPHRSLRSSTKHLLVVPKVRLKSYGERCFIYAAAKEWNKLPDDIKLCPSIPSFKSKLKTHLFKLCFDCK